MSLARSDTPVMYTQNGVTASTGIRDSLKGSHVYFNGYGIDVNETVTFGTIEEYDIDGNIQKVPTYQESIRYSVLVRVIPTQNGVVKDSWFNMSVLSRQMNEADGTSKAIDPFREKMIDLVDDYQRLIALAGKSIIGTGIANAFRPKFEMTIDMWGRPVLKVLKNEDGTRQMEPAQYVTVEITRE